jgi:murein DD-endopeptidase MepM/ murein hydrolase activator NlpD
MVIKYLKFFLIALGVGIVLLFGYYLIRSAFRPARYVRVVEWIRNADSHPDWAVTAKDRCSDAPFIFPTDGYIGFIWDDSFRPGHRHAGLDIFGGKEPGITPIYAAYDGYLTRKADWKSSVIIRIPSDPLNPGTQIWTYYTHMADPEGNAFIDDAFPPGSEEIFVPAGTLLGYQGNYSGNPDNPTGIHLHFSIVKDDGAGGFLNELEIKNTLDPSEYFNLPLNAKTNRDEIPLCRD